MTDEENIAGAKPGSKAETKAVGAKPEPFYFKVLVLILIIVMMGFELWLLQGRVDTAKLPTADFLRLIALLTGLPVLLIIGMYDKLDKETAGVILTAIVSFALGQASRDSGDSSRSPQSANAAETTTPATPTTSSNG